MSNRARISISLFPVVILIFALQSAHGYENGEQQADRASPGYQEGFVPVADGVTLYYRKLGDGERTIILPARLFAFDDFSVLGKDFTLISYDMRNRGRSSYVEDGASLTLENDVADMEAVRAHFDVERFSAIGYSYLGKVVVMFARQYPERIERLVQIGAVPPAFATEYPEHLTAQAVPSPYAPEDEARLRELREKNYDESHPREYCEEFWQVSRYGLVGNAENVDRLGPGACDMPNEWPVNLARHLRYAFEQSAQSHVMTSEQIAEVDVPVLTVHGTADRNAPYGAGREWALSLPNARLLTVQGAGHQVWADAPQVLDQIGEFLNGAWPAGAERVTQLDPSGSGSGNE